MHSKRITLPPKADLVLSFRQEFGDGTHICGYYLADHTHRSIFWLDGFNTDRMLAVNLYNTSEASHLSHAIEAEYWLVFTVVPIIIFHCVGADDNQVAFWLVSHVPRND